jgi:hypothetical protein
MENKRDFNRQIIRKERRVLTSRKVLKVKAILKVVGRILVTETE